MDVASRIERALSEAVALAEVPGCPPKLAAAMRYAVFPKGARVRPRLVHSVATACGEDHPAATEARVHERSDADVRDHTRPMGGDLAVQLRRHPLRDAVGLAVVALDQMRHARSRPRVSADPLRDQALMPQVRHSLLVEVADPGGVNEGQVSRVPAGQECVLDRVCHLDGEARKRDAAHRYGGTIGDPGNGL